MVRINPKIFSSHQLRFGFRLQKFQSENFRFGSDFFRIINLIRTEKNPNRTENFGLIRNFRSFGTMKLSFQTNDKRIVHLERSKLSFQTNDKKIFQLERLNYRSKRTIKESFYWNDQIIVPNER